MKSSPKMPLHVVFVCVSNRVRSVFAEFVFTKMLSERDERLNFEVKVSSAGFLPQNFRDRLEKMRISIPEPFYNRPMAQATRAALLNKDIVVSPEWRSKQLSSEMVEDADLIITALPEQKEELLNLYPEVWDKVFTIREISDWNEHLIFEDFGDVPLDGSFWDYVEENPDYVSKMISVMEGSLIRAFPNVLKQIRINERVISRGEPEVAK